MKTSSKVLCDLIALAKLTSSVSIECVRQGLPWWLSGKESAYQCRILGFSPWAGKIFWRRKWQPISVVLPGKSHGRRSLACCSSWGSKNSNTTYRLNNNNSMSGKILPQDHCTCSSLCPECFSPIHTNDFPPFFWSLFTCLLSETCLDYSF